MAGPALILFDDRAARAWEPFALTRPAGELRFGGWTLRERAERVLGIACIGHLADPNLRGFEEADSPGVLAAPVASDRAILYLSSRAVLEPPAPTLPATAALLTVGGVPCGLWVPPGAEPPTDAFLADPESDAPAVPVVEARGRMLGAVWDLIAESPEQIGRDARGRPEGDASVPQGVHRIGDAQILADEGVVIEPGAVLDVSRGPVVLESGVVVRAFTRLEGPAWIGRDTTLLGGPIGGVSIGPVCKVHGELEESVVLGFSNKAHDGFLGHAYVGRWVNLGALTTNSDLKNNYGSVRLWTPGGTVDTGRLKLGCLLGDHVKTAIGTLLNTGTVVGAGSNLFGAGMPPKYVPPFSWGGGGGLSEYDLDKFLETARAVMARRNQRLSSGAEDLLRGAWRRSAPDRASNGSAR